MSTLKKRKLTRRDFLKGTVSLGVAAASSTFLSGCGPSETETEAPSTGADVSTGPIHLKGWSFRPAEVEENVATFENMYDEDVDYELVTGTRYPQVMESKFIVNDPVDVCYSENNYANRWYHAGWIRDLEGLSEIDQIKSEMLPNMVEECSNDEGKLVGIPYYTGFFVFIYNEILLDKIGAEPPTSLEEITEYARKLKADGHTETPILARDGQQWSSLPWQLYGVCFGEGEYLWDADGNPTFGDGGVAFKKVLEAKQTWHTEGLTHPDDLSLFGYPTYAANGNFAFGWAHNFFLRTINDPATGPAAGHIKITPRIPGATGESLIWSAMYLMGADTPDPERALNLMKFCGWKNKDGEPYVLDKWLSIAGLGNPYPDLMNRDKVKDFWSSYVDYDVMQEQQANTRQRSIVKELWYAEWEDFLMPEAQACYSGDQTVDQTIENLATRAIDLKKDFG